MRALNVAGMKWLLALVGLAVLLVVPPAIGRESVLFFLIVAMVWMIFAIGFDLAFGLAGLLSLGHAALYGGGGYVCAILCLRLGVPFIPALLAGGLAAAAIAALFGVLSLRVAGIYLGLTTLAIAQLLYSAASTTLRGLTGGDDGLPGVPRPDFWGIDFYSNLNFYFLVAAVFILAFAGAALLRASPLGQVLSAIKQNPVRTEHLGFDIGRYKIAVLAISGFYGGIAGGLMAAALNYISPSQLHWLVSGDVAIMVLLGGSGTLLGPVLGVLFFQVLREVLSWFTLHWHGILGVIFILYVMLIPNGLAGIAIAAWTRLVKRGAR